MVAVKSVPGPMTGKDGAVTQTVFTALSGAGWKRRGHLISSHAHTQISHVSRKAKLPSVSMQPVEAHLPCSLSGQGPLNTGERGAQRRHQVELSSQDALPSLI